MIQFNKVSKRFPSGHYALKNVTFKLNKGEMAFLTGHSGAGKSTILRIIALLETITGGEVFINGKESKKIKSYQKPYYRRAIGLINQSPQLLWNQTVFDNVALPMNILGIKPRELNKRVRASLDKVDLLNKERMLCHTLSTGEQQRVAIARAVVNRPAILLADEPTGNLDPRLSKEILKLFESFNNIGTTVLIATHNLTEISSMPYPILTLNKGVLVDHVGEFV